jgi:membrane protein involved in colicin uptake
MSAAGHQEAWESQRKSASEAAASEASKSEKAAEREATATSIANKLAPLFQGNSSGGANKNNGSEASMNPQGGGVG